jgi:cell division protein FtsZ
MRDQGMALMGTGRGRGDKRALDAAHMAISSPLLEASIDGAHGVLLSIQGGSDLGLFEINEAARLVQEAAHPEANIIFGAVIDDALGDEVRVTVIAAGFDSGGPTQRHDDRALGQVMGRPQQAQQQHPVSAVPQQSQQHQPNGVAQPASQQVHPAPVQHQQQPQHQQAQQLPTQQPSAAPVHQQQPQHHAPAPAAQQPPRQVTFDEGDDLDVPDFLK